MISPKEAIALVKQYACYLQHNFVLLDILEGNLFPYIDCDMKNQMNIQSYTQASFRTAPINVLPKVIDKLTNIYQTSVVREVEGGTDSDKELLSWYEEKLDINNLMNSSNELFNACKASLIYPFVYEGTPYLRVIQNDKFVVTSTNPILPCEPTDIVICAGKKRSYNGLEGAELYWVYGEEGFYITDGNEKIQYDEMALYNNIEGVNPIAPELPFVYINESRYKIMPTQDTDVLKIIKVLPVMLTDLNFAAMFQCFSILYAINLDDANIKFAPNALWKFKTDLAATDQKPELGTIKPVVDYDQVLNLIQTELSMWLGTKGIRPGTVGTLSPDNFASGISKIMDEMDTYEARQKQVAVYANAESELWDLILNHLHPYWVSQGLIENTTLWSGAEAKVKTTFAVQLPMQSRGQAVTDLKAEFEAGFTTRKRAIQKLNPQMTSNEVDQLIADIDEERGFNATEDTQVSQEVIAQDFPGQSAQQPSQSAQQSAQGGSIQNLQGGNQDGQAGTQKTQTNA